MLAAAASMFVARHVGSPAQISSRHVRCATSAHQPASDASPSGARAASSLRRRAFCASLQPEAHFGSVLACHRRCAASREPSALQAASASSWKRLLSTSVRAVWHAIHAACHAAARVEKGRATARWPIRACASLSRAMNPSAWWPARHSAACRPSLICVRYNLFSRCTNRTESAVADASVPHTHTRIN